MNTSISELTKRVAAQAAELPAMYGRVDFSITPERFADGPDDQTAIGPELTALRQGLLSNEERVARIKAYTMMGDVVVDAYAALMPTYGFRKLIQMVQDACDHGLEKLPEAPPELIRFIRDMERKPAWLDMKLVEQGARIERNATAHVAPYAIRGAFIATFMNKYSALPMALTGALSNDSSARRVNETATFFTTTVMPGALERYGAGFKAAAMVRLMHSMVRFNVLRRGDNWDLKTYGIPIPQVDQMPAGLISIFLLAKKVIQSGRTTFTEAERARVELSRYRCFLLGLPEELLPETPQAILDILLTRHATLRQGFDKTCSALVTATMAADLNPDPSLSGRLDAWLERGFAKTYFLNNFMRGDKEAAAKVGVRLNASDRAGAMAAMALIVARTTAYAIAARLPGIRDVSDRALVRKLTRLLARYGHAEFTTDANQYRSSHA